MLRQIITGVAGATPGTPESYSHNLAQIPALVLITSKANAVFYLSNKDAGKVDLTCSVASAGFEMLLAVDHSIIK